jgi:hypothetical protein
MRSELTTTAIAATLLLAIPTAAPAGTTAKVGGSGGTSTVTMDCGSSAFIVGLSASGGRDNPIAPNLVRKLRFTCRPFSGTTPGGSTSPTAEAVAGIQGSLNPSQSSVLCPQDKVVAYLEVYAGIYIDRIANAGCKSPSSVQSTLGVNVGGEGGSRQHLECPQGEGLYKVEARVGSSIDSLKGTCLAFGAAAVQPLAVQISTSLSPKPNQSSPVKIVPGSSKDFSFKIAGSPNERIGIGIAGDTDLLGGGAANPPEFKLEVLTPSGSVAASRTVSKPRAGTVNGVNVTINAAGTWKLRVTNLKKDYGALDVRAIYSGALY